jgi:hypothetical protein
MGGGGGGGELTWQQQVAYTTQFEQARKQAADATQQQLAGVQMDWLRNYGQSTAMTAAGIPAPFATKGGGFATPFMSPAGAPIGGAAKGASPSGR